MLSDLRFAFRLLIRSPGFTIAASLTLALGIGANAVIFSLVDAALYRAVPYVDADRLVYVYRVAESADGQRFPGVAIGGDLVERVRAATQVFEGVEVFRYARATALATGLDQSLSVGGFAPGLPSLLGVRPQLGRGFTTDDVTDQGVVILSDSLWQRRFHRDPGVLGKMLPFSDRSYIVVGVMPPTFRQFVGAQADAWLPAGDRDGSDLAARLRPGLTVAQARRELDDVVARFPPSRPRLELEIRDADWRRGAAPPPSFVGPRLMLLALMGAVGFVLLVASANIANLLLARTLAREREIAVRGALGARRWQLARQFLIEGMMLAGLSGVAAIAAAWWGIRVVPAIVPSKLIPALLGVSLPQLDWRVLAFGSVVVFLAGVSSSLAPALRASSRDVLHGLLAVGQRVADSSNPHRRIRTLFQAGQIALTLVLLAGAGLFVSSFVRMVDTPTGFDSVHLTHVALAFPPTSFPSQTSKLAFADELIARISAVRGVVGVALGQPPVSGDILTDQWVGPSGDPARAVFVRASRFRVGHDYFRVAGIALTAGRPFGPEDQQNSPKVVIVSENVSRRFWEGGSAVGQAIALAAGGQPYTVVGVAPHLRTVDFLNDGVELFFPATQYSDPPSILVRTAGDAVSVADSIRALARAVDARASVQRIDTADHLFAEADPLGSPSFYALLLGGLALLCLLTASVGFYGVMSFEVGRRRREIAVRVALGADPASVRRLFLGDFVTPVALGVAAGLVVANWLSKFVASQLFHISPRDPMTIAAIVVLLVGTCGLAALIPARRAMQIGAVDALRSHATFR
jgi:putative ABC transport system permease protein